MRDCPRDPIEEVDAALTAGLFFTMGVIILTLAGMVGFLWWRC